MTTEEMITKAKEGYFIRDAERNFVICPMGEMLRVKSIKSNGNIRYCNKLACKRCSHKCTRAKFKEADFSKDQLIKRSASRKKTEDENGPQTGSKLKRKPIVYKMVSYVLHLDQNKMNQRKCISEHPFGTLKRSLNDYYFLLKTKVKVEAEMALFGLSYNMRRAINMVGVEKMMAALA